MSTQSGRIVGHKPNWIEIRPEIYHIMPNDGRHIRSMKCWCSPFLDYKDEITQNEVWEHIDYVN